jgi:hypothetical protein
MEISTKEDASLKPCTKGTLKPLYLRLMLITSPVIAMKSKPFAATVKGIQSD